MSRTRLLRSCVAVLLSIGVVLTVGLLAASIDAALFHSMTSLGEAIVLAGGSLGLAAALVGGASVVRQVAAHRRVRRAVLAHEIRRGVVLDPVPRAFCLGLLRPRVVVTTGSLHLLEPAARRAVIAHERAHARRRDGLRLLVVRALGDALFFCPGARQLVARSCALAELAADEAAERRGLAAAMLRFERVEPERVDRLLGEPIGWRIAAPTMALGGVAVGLTGLAALTIAAQTGCADDIFVAQLCDTSTLSVRHAAVLALGAVAALALRASARHINDAAS